MAEQHTSLSITFVGGGQTSGDWLKLEQAPWPDAMSASDFTEWLNAQGEVPDIWSLMSLWQQYLSQCDEEGGFDAEIQVNRSRSDLVYTLAATWGELSGKSIIEETREQSITIALEDRHPFDFLLLNLISAAWEGPVRNEYGETVAAPPITLQGDGLYFGGGKYLGSVRVRYVRQYDRYLLHIVPRLDADQFAELAVSNGTTAPRVQDLKDAYASTVTAFWGGQAEMLEIDPPPILGNCKGGTSLKIQSDTGTTSGGGGGDGQCYNRVITYDYCTGEVLSDDLEPVPC